MSTYYKNVSGNALSINLYGVGKVSIPAEAQSIEIEDGVAQAINAMAKPNIVLEKVSETLKNPVVMSEPVEGAENTPAEEDELEPAINYAAFTNKKLKALCEEAGIPVHRNANKAELLDLLGVGGESGE